MRNYLSWVSVIALSSATLGCGGEDPRPSTGEGPLENAGVSAIFPLVTGNSWSFRVTSDQGVADKVTSVGAFERVGGSGPNADAKAFHITTRKGTDLTDETESYQLTIAQGDGLAIVRLRELSHHATTGDIELEEHWKPFKLRVDDYHSQADGQWSEDYFETKLPVGGSPSSAEIVDNWIVLADDEAVTVPAGTFHAVKVRRFAHSSSDPDKTYWFARGAGKVKETGKQTEELTDCSLVDPDGGPTQRCSELAD
jgi:hypothetical protein